VLVANPNLCVDGAQVVADIVPGAVLRALRVGAAAADSGTRSRS
jgi:hypothetical protein